MVNISASTKQLKYAHILRLSGQLSESARVCSQVLAQDPDNSAALHLLGILQWRQNNCSEAITLLKKAISADPVEPTYYHTLGVVLMDMGHYAGATEYFQKALDLYPKFHNARCNLGLSLFRQQKMLQAVEHFHQVLNDCPNHKEALANLGLAELARGEISESIEAYKNAIFLDPRQPRWWGNLGAAYLKSGCFSQAAHCFNQALSFDPHNISRCIQLAVTLRAAGDLEGSIELLQSALSLDPTDIESMGELAIVLQQTCRWKELNTLIPRLDQTTRKILKHGKTTAEQPMLNIRRSSDLSLNLAVARSWSKQAEQRALRTAAPFTHTPRRQAGRRIHVGYLSYDFRDHPVAHQILPLFHLHDRSRFKVTAFSFGPNDHSLYQRRIQNDCDQFIDIRTAGTARAAQQIYDQGVDILVDLMGHTHHNRMEILALRPAPIQVGYLGFLASSGADYIDYLIADSVVVPEAHSCFYSEKLIRMPYSYQINHQAMLSNGESPGRRPARRKDYGLPEKSFVFCCFNRAYKIDKMIFETWTRILNGVPESVLWLYRDNPIAVDRLLTAAKRCSVEPNRLIFADKLALPEHLERLKLADLALDTATYNGGATTSNALVAGVPVLTILGGHWVSRMSASHLLAVGMPEMVAADLHAYEYKAIALANGPGQMKCVRDKLKQNLATSPLLDDLAFVRRLETALEMILLRFEKGLTPEHISLPANEYHLRGGNTYDHKGVLHASHAGN